MNSGISGVPVQGRAVQALGLWVSAIHSWETARQGESRDPEGGSHAAFQSLHPDARAELCSFAFLTITQNPTPAQVSTGP